MAGLKTADYIGKLAKDIVAEEVETFETVSVKEGIEKWPELPRIGYVLMLQSQGLMHDTYVYGVDSKAVPVHNHHADRDHGRCDRKR